VLEAIVAQVSRLFALEVSLPAHPLSIPGQQDAWQGSQLLANWVTSLLERLYGDFDAMSLAVVTDDITIPVMRYVLGQAQMGGRHAVISTARIGGGNLEERASKLAVHEVGHLFDLVHCEDPVCAMFAVVSMQELDRRASLLCRYCTADLANARCLRNKD
jgi:archaemetzincin